MSNAPQTKSPKSNPDKPELKDNYRPLGLKAVLAAALMVRRKPGRKAA
ncbi:hypothetical protein NAC44_06605 [Allorhizobium sp. BGMRC 0089]|nr:hypothetical protein [Allorhizobium sonneratiae]MCM2291999.1 hypothetical protein [Allorhizobium sonneratiae]